MSADVRILSFAKETVSRFANIFGSSTNGLSWGTNNSFPQDAINLYESVPEHTAAIDLIASLLVGKGIHELDYWIFKKIVLDYLLFGGFTIEVGRKLNGNPVLSYIDISKCRLLPNGTQIKYSEKTYNGTIETSIYNLTTSSNKQGVFFFKGYRSREFYPVPYYLSALKNLDTLNSIFDFHNNTAQTGFSPNVVINFNNGIADNQAQEDIERKIKDKFTGKDGMRFLLSFNDSKEQAISIDKLDDDNIDEKFDKLQKFLRNEILIAHRITSQQLVGVTQEGTGFSKAEWSEALDVFKETTVKQLSIELNYAIEQLIGTKPTYIEEKTT